ncbi:MAG TPA: class I SAM-dependent methyltransferase [Mycobacteriales bacterium]|nr:class I SAM-dependent methyltransferase [Mycobacteriales bacterium]
MALDWGIGEYEQTASELEPVAGIVVDHVDVKPGERALDLGCGTGNAALALARAGAVVTAVDPAPRLLEVTRSRAATEALTLDVREGEAATIPLGDHSADVIVSVFAVIFAPDPPAAMAEMARVLAPGGRIVLTAWIPGYGMGQAYAALGTYLSEELGLPTPPARFAWHDRGVLTGLAEPHGFDVSLDEVSIAFRAESPEAQVELDATAHPMWLDTLAQVRDAGGDEQVMRERVTVALHDINEDPAAFRTTSRYVIATLS